mmetsp:Transcript_12993/g.39999  ORF Transcript_12993/g.39999 Transcript_12993/m.39999 type:complete len:819 (-) Transcript_12993:330-2786(-)|eukprot:CAMPEP_0198732258 /NCGR_PEP_ID=MMETSP1475-20131203/34647_1 /TAXON_ID= ORGANISM="Unidentified sp., Strain CCMP1999" /NCGR_SAMPLE_ID=MMETSP1475 /ASSEMBLY_ACC=CAM_ASM_001111 /LENGTH=818 /DNA_ID=CAMNT_0044495327 /DNA_START=207 /DNA_END=2663 /DNA_ORIENTATION=+
MEEQEPAFVLHEIFALDLTNAVVTCVATSARFVAVGTSRGGVHVLDVIGNTLSQLEERHKCSVASIAFGGGRFGDDVLASVGRDDGLLIVTSSIPGASSSVQDIRTRVTTSAALNDVAIDPFVDSAPHGKRFAVACSDGKVQVFTANWFMGSNNTLKEGEGEVRCLKWVGDFLTWSTPTAVHVYNMSASQEVCVIDLQQPLLPFAPADGGGGAKSNAAFLDFIKSGSDSYKLCITTTQFIKNYEIAPKQSGGRRAILKNTYSCEDIFRRGRNGDSYRSADQHILLASSYFGDDELVNLSLNSNQNSLDVGAISMLANDTARIMSVATDGEFKYSRLRSVPGSEPMAVINFGERLLTAKSLSCEERLAWLIERGREKEAISLAGHLPPSALRKAEAKIYELGSNYLHKLLDKNQWEELAKSLPDVVRVTTVQPARGHVDDENERSLRKRWERWIQRFIDVDQAYLVAESIPLDNPKLSRDVYDSVLLNLIKTDSKNIVAVLNKWGSKTFDVPLVSRKLEERIASHPEKSHLKEALLILYDFSSRHDETLALLLHDNSPRVFEYIISHKFYEAVRSKSAIASLYEIDKKKTTQLLARAPTRILPSTAVVPILEELHDEKRLYGYLNYLYSVDADAVAPYHHRLLQLHCEHGAPGSLLRFLQGSHYSLEDALRLVRDASARFKGERDFSSELVFIMRRMGDYGGALDILLKGENKDVKAAIEFAREQRDAGLWNRLIDEAAADDEVLSQLLDAPYDSVDSLRLVSLVKDSTRIPNLGEKLQKLVSEAAVERELRETTTQMLAEDVDALMRKLESVVIQPLK